MLDIYFVKFWVYTVLKSIQVVLAFYLLKLILLQSSLTAVIAVALVFSLIALFVYEQYECELDGPVKLLHVS
ncbi:hypothetical protein Patl1_26470 [Pistacia atlantica]|uniref:Uncharacterized protein n=1 Tax=Pistacia atlantica TaxID=434234 RepID=A0ACC1B519_9ROSI|nr:hypothetical protein Patl1_26470 [Pistacia atlantica]